MRYGAGWLSILMLAVVLGGCGPKMVATPVTTGQVRTVMVALGAKNPTLKENRYQDLKFVYTPKLKSLAKMHSAGKAGLMLAGGDAVREQMAGEPKLLAEWWLDHDLRWFAVFFDANGTGGWQGWINRKDAVLENYGKGVAGQLGAAMAMSVDDKQLFTEQDGGFDPANPWLVNRPMPSFQVTTSSGKTTDIRNLIGHGVPTLVVFYRLPEDFDLEGHKQSGKGQSAGEFFSAVVQGMEGAKQTNMFNRIEGELYGRDIRD